MRIAIGADHRGFNLKRQIQNFTFEQDIKWIDVGTDNEDNVDYPLYTLPVCLEVLQGSADLGILICGTGIGMSIAANRFAQIYAALVWNEEIAKSAKEKNNANILILPANFITQEQAQKIINTWLKVEFIGGDYKRRINMIDAITDVNSSEENKCC